MDYWQKHYKQIFNAAKAAAERDGSAVCILNLNRVGVPMLVIRAREWSDKPECVAQVHADGTITEFLDSGNRPLKK